MTSRSVIVAGARTPIGRFRGALSGFTAMELGGRAIAEALSRSGVAPVQVDYVLMGHVLQAAQGQITARQAAIEAGVPKEVPAVTINKVCPSGMTAIAMADQAIRAGDIEIAVAGGMESMTNAPYALPKARDGNRLGHAELIDTMQLDGLTSPFSRLSMGEDTDGVNVELGISRVDQDAWAARSHQRAHAGWESRVLEDEVLEIEVVQRRGDPIRLSRDEGIRPETTTEVLGGLRSAFGGSGTVTAGNASQISDGAAAVVVMSSEKAAELGLEPLAEIVAYGMAAERFPYLHTVPALSLQRALKRAGRDPSDLEVIEINEAFAAVAVHSTKMLGVDSEIVNPNGGAVAMGHPIGASGARLVLTLAHELRRRGASLGGAAICGGGGQGDALLLRRP
ncbi:MAG: acetyl-CoA C-acetyltransferase [Actinomycetota bacterium]